MWAGFGEVGVCAESLGDGVGADGGIDLGGRRVRRNEGDQGLLFGGGGHDA